MKELLISISSSYFTAGVIVGEDKKVFRTAPILKYMKGWNVYKVIDYCKYKKWIYILK